MHSLKSNLDTKQLTVISGKWRGVGKSSGLRIANHYQGSNGHKSKSGYVYIYTYHLKAIMEESTRCSAHNVQYMYCILS